MNLPILKNIAALWLQLTMWLRYRSGRYELTQQWHNIGCDTEPKLAYAGVKSFVQETVAVSPRPYGQGSFGLVLAAIWPEPGREDRMEITFDYAGRQSAYVQICDRMQSWDPHPLAIMVGVLPYGALATGRLPEMQRRDWDERYRCHLDPYDAAASQSNDSLG